MDVIVEDASVEFGGVQVFRSLSATFPSHSLSALVGPSGSGKSSLLGAIAGYQRLSRGRVTLHSGRERLKPCPRMVTWISQSARSLGARTVVDNVMIGPLADGASANQARSRAMSAIEDVGLSERRSYYAKQLSGGELQRVAFARGLASSRPLILADEPSASLDEENTLNLARLLKRLRGAATIIVATHDPVLVAAAEAVVSLRERDAA